MKHKSQFLFFYGYQPSHFPCLIFICTVLTALLCGCDKSVHVSGRIYVITKGEAVIPMPSVDVLAYREDLLKSAIGKCNNELAKIRPEYLNKLRTAIANDAAESNRLVPLIQEADAKVAQLEPLLRKGDYAQSAQSDSVVKRGLALEDAKTKCNDAYNDWKQQKEWEQQGSSTSTDVQQAYNKYLILARAFKAAEATYNKMNAPVKVNGVSLADLKQQLESASNNQEELKRQLDAIGEKGKVESEWNSLMPTIVGGVIFLTRTTTDSSGNFGFTFDTTGTYILVATGERVVADETEKYFWVSTDILEKPGEYKIEINNADDMRQKVLQSHMALLHSHGNDDLIETAAGVDKKRSTDLYMLDIFTSYGLNVSLVQ